MNAARPPTPPALYAPTGTSRLRIWLGWFTLGGFLMVLLSIMSVVRGVGPREVAMVLVLFVVLAWSIIRVERRRGAVEVDDEGIWSARQPRSAGLLHWSSVAHMHEHSSLGMVDLMDHVGKTRLSLSYDLEGFGKLRDLVLSRMAAPSFARAVEHRTSAWSSASWGMAAIAGIVLAAYFLRHDLAALAPVPAALALVAGWMHLRAPAGVRLERDRVTLLYHFSSVSFHPREVESVELLNEPRGPFVSVVRGARRPTPVANIALANGKSYRISNLTVALPEFCRDLECVRNTIPGSSP